MAKKTESTSKTGTTVKPCKCACKYQDERYGEGKRLCNKTTTGGCRCTSCGEGK